MVGDFTQQLPRIKPRRVELSVISTIIGPLSNKPDRVMFRDFFQQLT
jgi:hypothetical protein